MFLSFINVILVHKSSETILKDCLIDLKCKSEGFQLECGRTNIIYSSDNIIEETDKDIPYYQKFFYSKGKPYCINLNGFHKTSDHMNFMSDGEEDRSSGIGPSKWFEIPIPSLNFYSLFVIPKPNQKIMPKTRSQC